MIIVPKKLSRTIILLLAFCLVFTSFGTSVAPAFGASSDSSRDVSVSSPAFSDLSGHWAEKQVEKWVEDRQIEGYEDGTFRPDNKVSRGEIFALINRSFEFTAAADIRFSDLDSSYWAYGDAAKAVQAGYVQGYADGTIGAKRSISRQEIAVMIARLLDLSQQSTEKIESGFTDAGQIAPWAAEAVAAAAAVKVMEGYPDKSFQPSASITRAEAVVTLERALKLKAQETLVYSKAGTYGPVSGVQTIQGNVVVEVPGVTLQNMEIKGSLLLAKGIGEGDVTLQQVTVKGTTTINGGGSNSIHVANSFLASVIVDRAEGTVRIVLENNGKIAAIRVKSSVILEQAQSDTGIGFELVQIMETLKKGVTVVLKGHFNQVEVTDPDVTIELLSGKIEKLKIGEQAQGSSLKVATEATIVDIILDTIVKVLGQGVIQTATVNEKAKGSEFEKRPQQLKGAGVSNSVTSGSAGNGGNNGTPTPTPTQTPGPTQTPEPTETPGPTTTPEPTPIVIVSVIASNGKVDVALDGVQAAEPVLSDFIVEQIINGGSPVIVSPVKLKWDEAVKEASLTIPPVAASGVAQSVLYRVSYLGTAAVDSAAFVIPAGTQIVANGQAQAVVVIPSDLPLAVDQIPGWFSHNTFLKGNVRVTDIRHNSGSNSLHINDDNEFNYTVESNLMEVTPGVSYTASAYYYLESGELNPALIIYFYDANKTLLTYPAVVGITAEQWEKLTVTGSAPQNAKYASVVMQSDSIGRRSVYFDDIEFKETSGNVLTVENPGFEQDSSIAAETLVKYINKSTGVELPVVTEEQLLEEEWQNTDHVRIYVGGGVPSEETSLHQLLGSLNSEGFVIQTTDDVIRISGSTSWGTEFGVYEFLERYLGIRWLMPGEDGEHVPTRNAIVLPRETVSDEPTSQSRHIFWMETPAENPEWLRLNRMHDNIQFHHNLEHLFDPVVFADHPEYYPGNVVPEPGSFEWNPCLNSDTAAAAVERIVEYFEKNPGATSFSLGVTDSRAHCESDPSHPNYPGADHLNSVGLLNMSDLYYPWVNEIVEGVLNYHNGTAQEGKLADKYFGMLAYAQVYDPPKNEDGSPYKLHPNVVPYITDDRLTWLDSDIDAEAQILMDKWLQSATHIGFYEYLFGSPYNLPRMYLQKMADNYKYAEENRVIGHVAEWLPNFGEGPKLWLAAKMQWNADQDVDALTEEWYETAVGPDAAPYLQQYYEHWEEFWTTRIFESDWYLQWKYTKPRSNYLNIYTHEYLTMITKEELQAARELMEQVVNEAQTKGTAEQQKRAAYLMGTFEFYEASALSFPREDEVEPPVNETEALAMLADFKLSLQKAAERKQYIEANQMRYMQMWDGVQQVLMNALLSYVEAHEDENGIIRGEINQILAEHPGMIKHPAYAVKTTASKDIILQSLDFEQGPWVNAKPFNDFLITPSKEQPTAETKVRLLWDDAYIYVGYENFDPNISGMITNDAINSAINWWNGATPDSVETFLGDTKVMYKGFFSNFNDKKIGFTMGVNPPTGRQAAPDMPWEVRSQVYSDRWNTIQAIPFSSIGIDPDQVSSLMGFFLRNYHGGPPYFSWYGGNTWATGDFNMIYLEDQPSGEDVFAVAVNGKLTVKLPAGSTEPSSGDFSIERVVNGGTAEAVTAAVQAWSSETGIAELIVPILAAATTDQSVVYRISYKGGSVVQAPAFVIAAEQESLVIVEEGQARAIVVVPTPTDDKIAGWKLTHPINEMVAGKMKVVSSRKASGSYSVHINDENIWPKQVQGLQTNFIPVTAGETYTASAKTYSESGSLPLILIIYYDSQYNTITAAYKEGGIQGEWADISLSLFAPANTAYASIQLFSDSDGIRNMYFDDIQFKDSSGQDLILENPGFEQISSSAADTLVDYIKQSSNAELEIITEERLQQEAALYQDLIRIEVGGSAPTGDTGLDLKLGQLVNDEYVIWVKGRTIKIMGLTDAGIEAGVRAFLERYLGVVWETPETPEVIPAHPTITIQPD
ncbi:DUF4838 domain-containing protein [Paenibacillus eucommiae]|uniref:SLH domain-containing protein n=1 Tax=Paenibacillus eucommiae TaxID=1355755 RepID=A0ABS4IZN6_9BACL|nr:DUF4838 domain-containing protein [Paenibacillus eucommiae]MBP1993047.1 hypothetical protein [Paenibacillus eucommiae]